MDASSVKYWVFFQIMLDLFLVALVFFFIRTMKSGLKKEASREAAQQVVQLIAPLLQEAEKTAATFDAQLKEKNRLVHSINERLDSRIISLNLLLNRATSDLSSNNMDDEALQPHIYDQQEAILALHKDNLDAETISKRLSMPKGEVELVIDLKRKFQSIP